MISKFLPEIDFIIAEIDWTKEGGKRIKGIEFEEKKIGWRKTDRRIFFRYLVIFVICTLVLSGCYTLLFMQH